MPATVIINNFKGQVTHKILECLKRNDIHVWLLPPNPTDRLQLMNVSVNKPVKNFLKRKCEEWYSTEVKKQLRRQTINEPTQEKQPVDLSMPKMKELGARWLVETHEYIASNSQLIVNGILRSAITTAFDTNLHCDEHDTFHNENFSNGTRSTMLSLRWQLVTYYLRR